MRHAARCPWCGEAVVVDDRPLCDPKAAAHLRSCLVVRSIERDARQRNLDRERDEAEQNGSMDRGDEG